MSLKRTESPSPATEQDGAAAALKLYDADDVNPSFSRFYPQSEQLRLTAKGLEPLFNWLEAPGSVAVADLGARARHTLLEFDGSTGFFDTATKYNTAVIVCVALTPSNDSIGLLKKLFERLESRVTWLIARSSFAHGTWEVWENTATHKALMEAFAREILAPTLDAEAWAAIDKHSLTAVAAADDKRLPLALRSHVFRWRQKYAAEFAREVAPLIKTDGKTLFVVTGDKGGVGKSSLARALTDWFLTATPSPAVV
jgi:hypothetical protein